MALVGHISGSAQTNSVVGISGSAIFANQPDVDFPSMPGSNVVFFVSGSANTSSDVSVFGGDVVVSGSLTSAGDRLELTGTFVVTHGISGSLTRLSDGTSYLVAGNNIMIASQSNGSVIISSTGGGGSGIDDFFDSTVLGSIFTSGSVAFVGAADEWSTVNSPSDKGTDVFFYVSGSIGSKNSATQGAALFGGDLVVSGSMFAEGSRLEITGALEVTSGISGSLTQLVDGSSYLVAGPGVLINSSSNGQVTISSAKTLQLFAGAVVSEAASGSMESIGMSYLDYAALPIGNKSYVFNAILAKTAGTTAYIDLYDYNGIINGTPGPVAGSVLTGSNESYTYLSADLTSQFSTVSSSGILEARIWCTPTGSNLAAICKSAKIDIL